MGNSSPPPPTNPPLLDKPWLEMNWGDREADLQFIKNYKPKGEDHHQFRILLQGPVGAGKSSFINSVISTLEGKICRRADANTGQSSFTKEYKMYSINKGDQGEMYPFVLTDMMGLENPGRKYRRVYEKDMEMAMKGHIKDGYTFNPEKALSKNDPLHYNQNPTIDDKVHILVSVIDADKVNQLGNPVEEIIQDIRDEATELGIPHVAILSKIDEACPEIRDDIKNVCQSRVLQEKIQILSKLVGIPENCIFPVKNYHSEKKLNHETDALILYTLRSIIEIGEEYLSNGKRSNLLGGAAVESHQDIRKGRTDPVLPAGTAHVADLTKTDDVCSEISSDEINVCRTPELQEKVQNSKKPVKIPESVYPVKNYDCVRSQAEPDEDFASCEKCCWVLKERTRSSLKRTQLHWEYPSKDGQGNVVGQQQHSDVMIRSKSDGNLPPQTDSGLNMRINLTLRRSVDS